MKLCKRFFAMLMLSVMLCLAVCPVSAESDMAEKDIDALIDEIAYYRAMYIGWESWEEQTGNPIENDREALAALGVKSDAETLAQLPLDPPIRLNGKTLDDLADLQEAFDGALDIWAVMHEVEGYQVCEVILADHAMEAQILSVAYQSNRLLDEFVFDQYTEALYMQSHEITLGRLSGQFGRGLAAVTVGQGSCKAISAVFDWVWSTVTADGNTSASSGGLARSYRIDGAAYPMIHYLYVRDSEEAAWVHTMTTDRIYVSEDHAWAIHTQENGVLTADSDTERVRDYLVPDGYGERLATAVAFYRSNAAHGSTGVHVDTVTSYTTTAAIREEVVGTMKNTVACPERPSDLLNMKRDAASAKAADTAAYLLGRVILIPVALLVGCLYEKRRKMQNK